MHDTFYCLVAGSRGYNNYVEFCFIMDMLLSRRIEGGKKIVIVSGGAKGADALAERYAKERGFGLKVFPAQWDLYGKSAGYKRNVEMQDFLVAEDNGGGNRGCICFWDGTSTGTRHNFAEARKRGTPLKVYVYDHAGKGLSDGWKRRFLII